MKHRDSGTLPEPHSLQETICRECVHPTLRPGEPKEGFVRLIT